MLRSFKKIYSTVLSKVTAPMVIKRSSLSRHKNPPPLSFKYEANPDTKALTMKAAPSYPNAHFFVASDIHFYDTSLGCEGADWEYTLAHDRKLFEQSDEIVEVLIKSFNRSRADFILLTGDLTKDGELACHEKMASYLSRIKKPVYVIPGNHDVLNPDASSFKGKAERVSTITKAEFEQIYQKFGFAQALVRDPNSLSYMVEVKKNLCLLALDTVWPMPKMAKELIVDGKLAEESWQWLEEQLIWAKTNNKAVFVAQHHPFLEHWEGEISFMPEYIIENYKRMAQLFTAYSVRMVFVGHFHAQDVTLYQGHYHHVYQILTGSPITYPMPYRQLKLKNNHLRCLTHYINKIPSHPNPIEFKNHARKKLRQAVRFSTEKPLKMMGVRKADRERIITSGANAYQANYQGYEGKYGKGLHETASLPSKDSMGLMGKVALKLMGYVIEGMAQNKSVFGDNNFDINLGH